MNDTEQATPGDGNVEIRIYGHRQSSNHVTKIVVQQSKGKKPQSGFTIATIITALVLLVLAIIAIAIWSGSTICHDSDRAGLTCIYPPKMQPSSPNNPVPKKKRESARR